MDKIYLKNNYVICEISSEKYEFSIYYTRYHETSSAITLNDWFGMSLTIPVASITSIYDEAGVTAYTTTTLLSFLRQNTGFKSPPGGSGGISDGDKGDITVSGLGSTWTIDNLAVTNAKINDVDGSKVTQSASYRLVTDTEKSTWNGKLTPNAPITGATKTKITYDANGLITGGADASTADIADSTNKRYVTDADIVKLSNTSGTNTGDQTSIVGISGTKAQFDTACTDGNFLYVGDITQYTDENAQDAVGGMAANSTFVNLTYVDATPSLTPSLSATGTPSATTFLRGDNTWATPTAADPEGWTTIVKSANQDASSSTLSNITDFSFSVVASGMYSVEMDIYYGCASSGTDIGIALNVSAGNMLGRIQGFRNQSNQWANYISILNSLATSGVLLSSGQTSDISNPHFFKIYGVFTTSANATLNMQVRAGTAGFSVRTMKGSILKYKKIN